jgi:malonate transporter
MSGVGIGFGIIGFVIGVGYLVGRNGIAGAGAESSLNRIAFFITNPALLFTVLAKADLHVILSPFIFVAFGSAAAAFVIFFMLNFLFFHLSVGEATLGAMSAGYVNANNIGLPVAVYVLGSATYVAPVLLLQLLLFAPIILTVLDLTSSERRSVTRILTQPLRNPMIIASIAGVVVDARQIRLPNAVIEPLLLLGGAAVPLVLLAFGMSLVGTRPLRAQGNRAAIVAATLIKSLAMPSIAFFLARYGFELRGTQLLAAVTLAALPAAQNAYNFASRYGIGMPIARDTVLLTTALSVPVLVMVAFWLS